MVFLRILVPLALVCSGCVGDAYAGDFLLSGASPGLDGGTTAKVTTIGPNSQFMVTSTASVNYRVCTSTTCTAAASDAPIAGGAQVDLCMPSGYNTASFYIGDGGSATVYVYKVNPKTVCQINSP